jgi:outer membrane protein TolC
LPLSVRDAIKLALENNNEIEAAVLDVESASFELKGARGAYDPTLSFQSYYEKSTTPTASALAGGSNGSLTDRNTSGVLNLGGSVPWQGGSYQLESSSLRLSAQANLGKSLAEGASIKSQRDQQEQQIESEVRNVFQAMRSAEASLKAATASRVSSEKLYESEQRKLQTGASTVYLVLERQQALVTAQGNELQAQTMLSKAIATHEKVTGRTLQANQITLNAGK